MKITTLLFVVVLATVLLVLVHAINLNAGLNTVAKFKSRDKGISKYTVLKDENNCYLLVVSYRGGDQKTLDAVEEKKG